MNIFSRFYRKVIQTGVWARPNMEVTFRAEIMPGKTREERTYRIEEVLTNGRIILQAFDGEHRESEFERVGRKP